MALPVRWTALKHHDEQQRYWNSPYRFNVIPSGRRSGKTELFKRKLVKRALLATTPWPPAYFAAAPTRDQAKRIFWTDLKALVDRRYLAGRPSETELMIPLINGAEIWVIGMDKPERIEGKPWDGGGLDEYANMKETAWSQNVRPALSDRTGWCDFLGVPEGRNHYYDLYKDARAMMMKYGAKSEWGAFHWTSAEILPPAEIEAAKRDLDDLSYDQEYNGSFINFSGRAYYPFLESTHTAPLRYNPRAPLIFCFDFNVDPGVCAVAQEMTLPNGLEGTGIIGEVYIPRNSNTPAVCDKLIEDWGHHEGRVFAYGDATGGARGTAKVAGSDWDIIEEMLSPAFDLFIDVDDANPKERARINAVNSRLKSKSGDIRLMVDASKAPYTVKDFEGVTLLEGGSGEIDKKTSPKLSHLTDGIGYYINKEFPVLPQNMQKLSLGGV